MSILKIHTKEISLQFIEIIIAAACLKTGITLYFNDCYHEVIIYIVDDLNIGKNKCPLWMKVPKNGRMEHTVLVGPGSWLKASIAREMVVSKLVEQ